VTIIMLRKILSQSLARQCCKMHPWQSGEVGLSVVALELFSSSDKKSHGYATSSAIMRSDQMNGDGMIRTTDPSIPLPRYVPPKVDPSKLRDPIGLSAALEEMLSQETKRKFDETVEIALNTGIDPRRGDQMVRGMASLPHGTGKKIRVCVFASHDTDQDAARQAGADTIGDDSLISKIQQEGSSAIDFDVCLATPDMMPKLGRIARILGPRGLMPNPKLGTVTNDVAGGVVAMKQGRVEFRADKGAVIHAGVGKRSFSKEVLQENIQSFVQSVLDARPKGLKGAGMPGYLLKMSLSTTMMKGCIPVRLDDEILLSSSK
jgi:large subunit ribosomal protein L1